MKKAIIIPYCCDQNEPSRPLPKIFTLPDNVKKRDAMLIKLFNNEFYGEDYEKDEDEDDIVVTVKKGKADDYGDLIVDGDTELWLFVTYIKD